MDIATLAGLPSSPVSDLLQARAQSLGQASRADVDRVATSFEAIFLSMVLKQWRQAMTEDGLFENDVGGIYGGLFDLYMGKHLAESGGLGLAHVLISSQRFTTMYSADGRHPARP